MMITIIFEASYEPEFLAIFQKSNIEEIRSSIDLFKNENTYVVSRNYSDATKALRVLISKGMENIEEAIEKCEAKGFHIDRSKLF